MTSLKYFIVVHENIVPLSLCDDILAEYADSDDWQETRTENNVVNKNIRNCAGIGMSLVDVINKNELNRRKLDNEVFQCATNALQKYRQANTNCLVKQDTGYNLLRYQEGQFYTSHTDSFAGDPREVSCSFVLNDNFDGGEFAFFEQELKYKIPKGSALMFPSNFMYPHEVMKVTSGIRYSIVTWFK
jgi:predicted 2-oxoglutarate/Fe(II)-dependent dioxygenase YbiX